MCGVVGAADRGEGGEAESGDETAHGPAAPMHTSCYPEPATIPCKDVTSARAGGATWDIGDPPRPDERGRVPRRRHVRIARVSARTRAGLGLLIACGSLGWLQACSDDDATGGGSPTTTSTTGSACLAGCVGGGSGTGGDGSGAGGGLVTDVCGNGTCAPSELCSTCEDDCGVCTGDPITVTRGPYLQMGTDDAVTVKWRTAEPSGSVVALGTTLGQLTAVANGPSEPTTEHEVRVTALDPSTQYFYAFGTPESPLVGGDAEHFFSTSPTKGTAQPTRLWVIGDAGTANANQEAVRDAYLSFVGAQRADLFLMLGDNAYSDGTDDEYQEAVFDMYPQVLKNTVTWATLGNHDGHSADSGTEAGPYYDIFSLPRQAEAGGVPSGTEAYYSFDYGTIHFVCLDSYDSDTSTDGDMLTWLTSDLTANTQPWLVAFWHHPPYTKGSHDSDDEGELIDMRERALPILESFGVDLILTGHSHSYERSYYISGHYGDSGSFSNANLIDGGDGRTDGDGAYTRDQGSEAGAVYVVAGSSGQTSGGTLDHPAMFVSLNELGSLVVDVAGSTLDATFIDDTGDVRDTFSIAK